MKRAAWGLALLVTACVTERKHYGPSPKPVPWSRTQQAKDARAAKDATPATTTVVAMPPPTQAELDARAMPLSALAFPRTTKDVHGNDLIRVKVFPHLGGKRNETIDQVTLAGTCVAYRGKRGRAAPEGKPLGPVGERVVLTPATLKEPRWFSCADGAVVERNPPLKSHRYLGSFYARPRRDAASGGKPYVEIVNIVPMEAYLRGVVPTEIVPSWPEESLKAQAVAARTYAYFNIAFNKHSRDAEVYDVDDTPYFQAYSGLTNVHPATDKAIRDTAGVVMSLDGKVVLTFFHADSGGYTESAAEVFALNAPYCSARREPDGIGDPAAWKETVKLADLARRLTPKDVPAGAKVTGARVEAKDKTSSGRVRAVTLTLGNGTTVAVGSVDFKRAAGGLLSSLYDVRVEADQVLIDGKGSGHGVGLSQRSAKDLAAAGWTYDKILKFYYEGAAPCALRSPRSGVASCSAAH